MKQQRRTPMQVTVEKIATAADQLDSFRAALETGEEFALRATVNGYMPLVIEVLGALREVSVSHYFRQNGDTMRDPEYVFESISWRPVEMKMDPIGYYRRARPGYYLAGGASSFCRMWAQNLRHQGFTDPATATYQVIE